MIKKKTEESMQKLAALMQRARLEADVSAQEAGAWIGVDEKTFLQKEAGEIPMGLDEYLTVTGRLGINGASLLCACMKGNERRN